MKTAKTITEVRNAVSTAKKSGKSVGFVPTMGALHKGHASLIEAAKTHTDFVVVSIFVNPTQFGPNEDFNKYPRPIENDLQICEENGVDLVFLPQTTELYPSENITWVNVEHLSEPLCGQFRPGHFRGVATVCAKLFNIVLPDFAFFGQKDAQQAIIITKMVKDLNMPLKIVICPTIREPDGLAMSSRNRRLLPEHRANAGRIFSTLKTASEMARQQEVATIRNFVISEIDKIPGFRTEYFEIVDSITLAPLKSRKQVTPQGNYFGCIALFAGEVRLIDNMEFRLL